LTVALIAAALPLLGTTYYVDQTGGADGHDGTSPATAWRTASKVNRSTFAPGDQVLFKRGGLWRETLTIPSSGSVANPIRFGAYGKGSKPTFYGASTVTGWSAGSGALFYAPWTFASNNVFQNDRPLKKAPSRAAMTAGSFYFEVSTSRLYIWTTTGADPTAFLIEASTNGPQWYGIIRALSKNNIVIQDLRVVKANYTGIYCEQCNNVVVRGNDIEQTFQNAITLVGNKGQLNSTNVTVEANTITDAGTGRGIAAWSGTT